MKQLSATCCLCVLLICGLAGAGELAVRPASSEVLLAPDQNAGMGLLYQYADEAVEAKRLVISTEVWIDGEASFADFLIIEAPNPQASPVVELFVDAPELADEITGLVKAGSSVIFDVYLGDELLESVSGIELLARSESLLRNGAKPQDVRVPFSQQAAAASSAKTYCYQCYTQYDTCVANNCDPQMPPRLCAMCDTIFYNCLDNCDDCHPGTVTELVTTLVQTTTGSSACAYYYMSGMMAAFKTKKYLNVETTTITYADCSTDVQVNTYYTYVYCWQPQGIPCSNPTALPLCI